VTQRTGTNRCVLQVMRDLLNATAVSNWQTTLDDVDRSVDAIGRALGVTAGESPRASIRLAP
jgi:hypothetical protein